MKHSLKFFTTLSTEVPNFPDLVAVAVVDEIRAGYCDSNKKITPELGSGKNLLEYFPQLLEWFTEEFAENWPNLYKTRIYSFMQHFNQSGGKVLSMFYFTSKLFYIPSFPDYKESNKHLCSCYQNNSGFTQHVYSHRYSISHGIKMLCPISVIIIHLHRPYCYPPDSVLAINDLRARFFCWPWPTQSHEYPKRMVFKTLINGITILTVTYIHTYIQYVCMSQLGILNFP